MTQSPWHCNDGRQQGHSALLLQRARDKFLPFLYLFYVNNVKVIEKCLTSMDIRHSISHSIIFL